MKKIIPAIAVLFLFASCKTSKDYLLRSNEDKTLYDVVKKLNKHADDENASKALAEVYTQVQQKHLDKIETYKSYTDLNRWDKISAEPSLKEPDSSHSTDKASRPCLADQKSVASTATPLGISTAVTTPLTALAFEASKDMTLPPKRGG